MKRKVKQKRKVNPERPKPKELSDLSPDQLEHFQVTQPTEDDVEEELSILRGSGEYYAE